MYVRCVWQREAVTLHVHTQPCTGMTWTPAVPLNASQTTPNASAPWGVEPKIAQLAGSGRVVISTGRPGIFVWASAENFTGDDSDSGWTQFNLAEHHNAMYRAWALTLSDCLVETVSVSGLVSLGFDLLNGAHTVHYFCS